MLIVISFFIYQTNEVNRNRNATNNDRYGVHRETAVVTISERVETQQATSTFVTRQRSVNPIIPSAPIQGDEPPPYEEAIK